MKKEVHILKKVVYNWKNTDHRLKNTVHRLKKVVHTWENTDHRLKKVVHTWEKLYIFPLTFFSIGKN